MSMPDLCERFSLIPFFLGGTQIICIHFCRWHRLLNTNIKTQLAKKFLPSTEEQIVQTSAQRHFFQTFYLGAALSPQLVQHSQFWR